MTPEQESLYEQIGESMLRTISQEEFTKAWVYAEQQEGVSGISLFYQSPEGKIHYQTPNIELAELFDSLWELSGQDDKERWTNATYILDQQGAFKIALNYDDIFNDGSTTAARRQHWIGKYIGDVEIQYPKPPDRVR